MQRTVDTRATLQFDTEFARDIGALRGKENTTGHGTNFLAKTIAARPAHGKNVPLVSTFFTVTVVFDDFAVPVVTLLFRWLASYKTPAHPVNNVADLEITDITHRVPPLLS